MSEKIRHKNSQRPVRVRGPNGHEGKGGGQSLSSISDGIKRHLIECTVDNEDGCFLRGQL